MGDFTPRFKPGQAATFTASAPVIGGQLVEVTGDMTVGPAAAGSTKVVGQPGHDAPAGARVTVHLPSKTITTAIAAEAIAAGDPVKASAGGQVAKLDGADPESARFGTALEAAGPDTDVVCRILPA